MWLKTSLVTALLITVHCCFSQRVLHGRIIGMPGMQPIAFANVGIVNTKVGTMSNADGTFSLAVSLSHLDDTVLFSALGFGRKVIPAKDLVDGVTIYLSEKPIALEPVTVEARKDKKKSYALGNRYTKGGFLYVDSVSSGAAMALLIENKYPAYHADLVFPVYLEKAVLFVDKNSLPEFKIRLRIMEHDTVTGFPGRDLLHEDVIVTSSIKRGWLDFDLTPYAVQVDRPFFLVYEWIMEDYERLDLLGLYSEYRRNNPDKVRTDSTIVRGEKIGFRNYYQFTPGTHFGVSAVPFSLKHYRSYYRLNSFGQWHVAPVVLTTRITVTNQHRAETRSKALTAECGEDARVCEAERLCETFIMDYGVHGMQVAVSKNGETVFSRCYGYANAEKKIPVRTNTRFRIGSVSKALTSAGLAKLVGEGKLSLDASVEKYVPSFGAKKYKVTLRQLGAHLGGIRHYYENLSPGLKRFDHYENATQAIAIFANDSLLFEPGSRYLYSSFGWNLIGAAIESASGEDYLSFMKTKVWLPLKMFDTCGDGYDSTAGDVSEVYAVTGEAAKRDDVSYKYPSGGLVSTALDLVRFGNEILTPNVLDAATRKDLFVEQRTNAGTAVKYGLGWSIGTYGNGRRVWFHAGNLPTSSAYLLIYPDEKLVVSFLANTQEGLLFDVERLAQIFSSVR
ncbi:MAG TPA: serine hydrolase [Chryseosolibacter sp.]|nr:serine hydrolase [Chryseosolibacter sp.]